MRLVAVELEEFRGWVRPARIELDASVVVLHGPNGTGKTSLFDAVLWALTGELPRLGDDHKNDVVSRYGESGNARVRLELRSGSGDQLTVTRSTDGQRTRLQVSDDARAYSDEEAALVLIRQLWPSGLGSSGAGGMASALARAVYLQQDDLRRFIEADSDVERFSAVAELVGAGVYTELQRQLERERLPWSRQINEMREAAAQTKERARQLTAQIESLPDAPPPTTGWDEWCHGVRAALNDPGVLPDGVGAPRVAEAVDSAVRRLDQEARAHRRTADIAAQARSDLAAALAITAPSALELEQLEAAAVAADAQVARLQQDLAVAEHQAADERDRAIQEDNQQTELDTLAVLALRHLGQRCPVCDQPYDMPRTKQRLADAAQGATPPRSTVASQKVIELSSALKAAEADRSSKQSPLRDARRLAADRARALDAVVRLVQESGISADLDTAESALTDLQAQENARADALHALARSGERQAVQLAQTIDSRRREQLALTLQSELASLRHDESTIAARDATRERASKIIDGLRVAAQELVSKRIESLGTILDRAYARIDPHPSFDSVRLDSLTKQGHGRLVAWMVDSREELFSENPQVVLSSSQLNALALSIFLALNLGVPRPPLDAVLLDDPLQSLDDVNLLGVVDLLRRIKARRQLFISTHDRRFASLLQRKLRATEPSESLAIVRLADWSREGPAVQQIISTTEESPWKIVANE